MGIAVGTASGNCD